MPVGYDTPAMALPGPISPDLSALADRLAHYNPWLHAGPELLINLKTAKTLTIPQWLLLRADQIIE